MYKLVQGLLKFIETRVAKTPQQKKIFYWAMLVVGAVFAYFGITVVRVSYDALLVLDKTPLG